jgi:predicted phage terminase large subunit-like protein
LYFVRDASGAERAVPRGTRDDDGNLAIGRTFIRAKAEDNPSLGADYKRRLGELDPLTRAQLRDGNWLIKPGAGVFYKRPWFEVIETSPEACDRVRYWDKAATEGAGDWTVGTRLARPTEPIIDARWKGKFIVEDVIAGRWSPAHVEAEVGKAAESDTRAVTIGMPQDPGAAGVFELDHYVRELGARGFAVRGYRETGDKITRQKPVSAQAEHGNILVVRGKWNERFFNMAEAYPDEGLDDIDSLAGAYQLLTAGFESYRPPAPKPRSSIAQQFGGY